MSQDGTNGASEPENQQPAAAPGADGPEPAPGAEADGSQPEGLEAQLAELTRERDELKDRLLRTAADFDNYRKRAKRDVDDAVRTAKESLLREFLPVIDNLERALAAAQGPTAASSDALAKGVELVLKLFTDTLGRFGVKSFQSKGTPFDPQLHEAIQQVETTSQPAGTVIEEFQKGYLMNDRLVRPAMVVVAKAPEAAAADGETAAGPNGVGAGEGDAGG